MEKSFECADVVSRQAVIDAFYKYPNVSWTTLDILEKINSVPSVRPQEPKIGQGMTVNNLCNSCTNIGCEFQSGIVRTECAFYMPPHIESDNCGNYVVLPSVRPQEPIQEQWQELKETILEMRDNDGTGTQQEVCKFLANYMAVLEKQMVEPQESEDKE